MDKILKDIIKKRNGHYCHVIETSDVWSLQSTLESLYDELIKDYTFDEVCNFLSSIQIIYFNEDGDNIDDENAVYAFDVKEFIKQL
ncbi:MAG: hypothetical protein RSC93_00065 [Erysipelotrichaceae bacterium]